MRDLMGNPCAMYPAEGTNRLTEQLLARGADPRDPSTWPEDAISMDGKHFVYRYGWKFEKTFAAPCGVWERRCGQAWGDLYVRGEYHCWENDNALFRCPYPEKPCPHRLADLPLGINCEFHLTDAQLPEETDCRRIESERLARLAARNEALIREHEGYWAPCGNQKVHDDGSVTYRWRMDNCRNCPNTVCPARGWRPRDITPANIVFDLYTEIWFDGGMVDDVKKTLTKGVKVYDKPRAKTDCEFQVAIWKVDPSSPVLPGILEYRLKPWNNVDRQLHGIQMIGCLVDGKRVTRVVSEIRGLRVETVTRSRKGRDLLADLQAAQEGVEILHESDNKRELKAAKAERRRQAKVEKLAKLYARALKNGNTGSWFTLRDLADSPTDKPAKRERNRRMREEITARAQEILDREAAKERRAKEKGEQMTLFDL